jgi:pimeloyl-ACP methyl ester carboxylesterase
VFAVAFALLVKFVLHLLLPRDVIATGEKMTLQLAGGAFDVPCFAGDDEPRGIVILGTGDGGWSYWEENTARHLAEAGFAVGGWDCRKFADSRTYTQDDLGAGFVAAVDAVRECSDAPADAPVWYGGWSTGAEQSVAAATSSHRARGLVGLLLAAPGTHGRYGITTSDLLGVDPSGPGTFALADMAPALAGLRVAQFAAGLDPLDDTDWIRKVPVHRLYSLPRKLHDMGGAGADFQRKLDDAIAWTLEAKS